MAGAAGLDLGGGPFAAPWGLSPDDTGNGAPRRPGNVVDMPQARRAHARVEPKAEKTAKPGKGAKGAPAQAARQATPEDESFLAKLQAWATGKPLTDKQAAEIRDDLIASYKAYADYADWFVSNTNRARAEAIIWSTIQDDEFGILADFALDLAKANPVIAQAVVGMARTARLAKVGAIIGPRVGLTLGHYASNGGFGVWMM